MLLNEINTERNWAQSLGGWEPFSFVLNVNLRPVIPISNLTSCGYTLLMKQIITNNRKPIIAIVIISIISNTTPFVP